MNIWDKIEKIAAKSFKPPASVAKEAQKALNYREKYKDEVKAGTRVGWIRANQLANRENISLDTIKRMKNFFTRHKKNKAIAPDKKDTPWKDNGFVAHLLWGGDAGEKWANNILNRIGFEAYCS